MTRNSVDDPAAYGNCYGRKLLEVNDLARPAALSAQISGERKATIGCTGRRKDYGRNTDIAPMMLLEFPVQLTCECTYYAQSAALGLVL